MTNITLTIPNISCGHCVHTIQTELLELEGVKSVVADLDTKQVEISYEKPASEEEIRQLLTTIEYPAAD
jgi:copper chaperone